MNQLRMIHDMPPFWDGKAVVWEGWQAPLVAFICGRGIQRHCCVSCGSDKDASLNFGIVAEDASMTRPQTARNHKFAKAGQPRRAWLRLTAFRCPDCGHDQVSDGDQMWDLDASDYGDDGSEPPQGDAA